VRRQRNLLPRKADDDDDLADHWVDEDLPTHDPRGRPYPKIHPTHLPADIVLARLSRVSGQRPTWSACCPAHPDDTPSLSVTETDEAVLLIHCHARCKPEEIVDSIGLTMRHLFPTPYALAHGRRTGLVRVGSRGVGSNGPRAVPPIDHAYFEDLLRRAQTSRKKLRELAQVLRLPVRSLLALEVGHDCHRWVFPERESKGRVTGLVYRYADGSRHCESGSKRGLTIPRDLDQFSEGPLYLPEGPTDTAALHSVGAAAIGRPAARTSRLATQWLVKLLGKHVDRPIIVVGDNDEEEKGKRPGRDGARELARFLREKLGRPVAWALPVAPYKDVREQITGGNWDKGLVVEETHRAAALQLPEGTPPLMQGAYARSVKDAITKNEKRKQRRASR
jgi:hypothetical protein